MQNVITELEHSLRKSEEAKTVIEKQSVAELRSIQRKYDAEVGCSEIEDAVVV